MFIIVFYLTITFVNSQPICYGLTSKLRAARFGNDLTVDNNVLFGHVFATVRQVLNFSQCFSHCEKECRCMSFNLPSTASGSCELNDADNGTALLISKQGWRYHMVEKKVVSQGSPGCRNYHYKNDCCDSAPCKNGAACTDNQIDGKQSFTCSCVEGYIGKICQKKVYTCLDYLWNNKNAKSGYYELWNNSGGKCRVYCDMRPRELEAWTLVMSYKLKRKNYFDSRPYFHDFPLNTKDPSAQRYRMSKEAMESIVERIGAENKTAEWRITCTTSENTGKSEDFLRSQFTTLNILEYVTNGTAACHRVDYIKIRGRECYNCNVLATQSNTTMFSINAYRGDKKCNFNSGSTVVDENIFGLYNVVDGTSHACASSNDATTQYWFGGTLV